MRTFWKHWHFIPVASLVITLGLAPCSMAMTIKSISSDVDHQIDFLTQLNEVTTLFNSQEIKLQSEFWSRLKVKVQARYQRQDFKNFLHDQIRSMIRDKNSRDPITRNKKFLKNLSACIKNYRGQNKNLIHYIANYIHFSGIDQSKEFHQFLNLQSYSNDISYTTVQTPDKQQVGDLVEVRLNLLDSANKATPSLDSKTKQPVQEFPQLKLPSLIDDKNS